MMKNQHVAMYSDGYTSEEDVEESRETSIYILNLIAIAACMCSHHYNFHSCTCTSCISFLFSVYIIQIFIYTCVTKC